MRRGPGARLARRHRLHGHPRRRGVRAGALRGLEGRYEGPGRAPPGPVPDVSLVGRAAHLTSPLAADATYDDRDLGRRPPAASSSDSPPTRCCARTSPVRSSCRCAPGTP
ncbi:MAG: hypothetical protein AVDCRST_MAG35-2287 [uncultured Quadrisphaera sp.]|uniref:Uncharacterized protein n=1 Tax=uncultured Quadrisphaera sp. TaxID=904978 RepID=A0A6J4PYD3_9ACTN|nr:MAG: hypothetical protein AVDCRST_MAG35-2287 [uncultured Quadrisphaera sp.]